MEDRYLTKNRRCFQPEMKQNVGACLKQASLQLLSYIHLLFLWLPGMKIKLPLYRSIGTRYYVPLILLPVHLLFFAFLIIFAYFTLHQSTEASIISSTSLVKKGSLNLSPLKEGPTQNPVPLTLKLSSSTNSLPDDLCER